MATPNIWTNRPIETGIPNRHPTVTDSIIRYCKKLGEKYVGSLQNCWIGKKNTHAKHSFPIIGIKKAKDTLNSKLDLHSLLRNADVSLRVIVADDNDDILSLFSELLTLKKFEVVGKAHNGTEAVEIYRRYRPEITFLDVVMPNGDGIYALEKIRETNPEAIVIMVTSDLAPTTTERLKQLQPSAVIYKPFDINDVIKIVAEIESKASTTQMKFFN